MTTTTSIFTTEDIIHPLNTTNLCIGITLYILGVCGAILNIFTFLQKQLRSHSCSMYFLAGSICDLCTCNTVILLQIISLADEEAYIRYSRTLFACKFDAYCVFLFSCLSSLYILMASIDRFCASSRRVAWRKFSTVRVSRIIAPCIFLIGSLFSLHIIIAYDWRGIEPNATDLICLPPLDIYIFFVVIDGYFFALFNGAIVPFFLTVFGILIIFHVRQTQRRRAVVHPVAQPKSPLTSINRENRHLIIMLLMQVSITIITTIPYIVIYLNNLYNPNTATPEYLQILYITTWLWYSNYCKAFYVNTLSSQFYRSILKKQVLHLFHRR